MTDQNSPDQSSEPERRGIVARLKQLYKDKPEVFAVGLIGLSGLLFLLGSFVAGDLSFTPL